MTQPLFDESAAYGPRELFDHLTIATELYGYKAVPSHPGLVTRPGTDLSIAPPDYSTDPELFKDLIGRFNRGYGYNLWDSPDLPNRRSAVRHIASVIRTVKLAEQRLEQRIGQRAGQDAARL